jgi:hypothetical protein
LTPAGDASAADDASQAKLATHIPASSKTPSGGWSPAKLLTPANGPSSAQVPASFKTPPGGWAAAKALEHDPVVDTSNGVVVDDASDEDSAPTRVDEAAPSASTVAAIAASIDHDDSPNTVTTVAYDAESSTFANGDDGGSTVNARPIRVPSESGGGGGGDGGDGDGAWEHPMAAADASADVDFDDPVSRESAPALPPPPAEHGGGFGSRPSTNNDEVTGVDMPFGGRAQSNVSTIFGDPASAMTYPPNTWPTGSRLVQTTPGFFSKLLASPKRIVVIAGSAALCFVLVYMVAFRGGSTPTAAPAPSEPMPQPTVQKPARAPAPAPAPAPPETPVVESAGSASSTPVEEPTPTPTPPVSRPKTIVKKPAVTTTKRVANVKKPAVKKTTTKPTKATTTTKPKKPAWDPNALFPTKRK